MKDPIPCLSDGKFFESIHAAKYTGAPVIRLDKPISIICSTAREAYQLRDYFLEIYINCKFIRYISKEEIEFYNYQHMRFEKDYEGIRRVRRSPSYHVYTSKQFEKILDKSNPALYNSLTVKEG